MGSLLILRFACSLFIGLLSFFSMGAVPFAAAQEFKGNPAREVGPVSNLPLPRFVSLRSELVYVRAGPGMRYPVKWVYHRRHYPLEVVQEFDTWRKIRDIDNEEGWVHQSLLSSNRYALVQADAAVTILHQPEADARPVAQVEPHVLVKLDACKATWCEISASGYEGWLLKNQLWGVYEGEESE